MKKVALLLLAIMATRFVNADEDKLHIMSAWAPATFKLAVNGAAYISAHNMTGGDVAITDLSVDEVIARKVELHETFVENEMARMRPVAIPLTIADGDSLSMARGGQHIMLLGLKKPLQNGQTFTVTFYYADDTTQEITVEVTEQAEASDHSHHH